MKTRSKRRYFSMIESILAITLIGIVVFAFFQYYLQTTFQLKSYREKIKKIEEEQRLEGLLEKIFSSVYFKDDQIYFWSDGQTLDVKIEALEFKSILSQTVRAKFYCKKKQFCLQLIDSDQQHPIDEVLLDDIASIKWHFFSPELGKQVNWNTIQELPLIVYLCIYYHKGHCFEFSSELRRCWKKEIITLSSCQ